MKNKAHLDWVHSQGLYNLRADPDRRGSVGLGGRELASDLVILYGPHMPHAEIWHTYGEPRLLSRAQLIDYAYPNPRGTKYFALPIKPIHDDQWPHLLPFDLLAALQAEYNDARQFGAPITLSWLTLALATTQPQNKSL